MASLLQALLNGFCIGWIYVLTALGLSLIFGVLRVIQFAHGEVCMVGAYLAYALVARGLPLLPAALLSAGAMTVVGYGLERGFFRRLRGKVHASIMFSLGLLLVLQSSTVLVFGLSERSLPRIANTSFGFWGVSLPVDRLLGAAVAMALVAVVFLALQRTRYGLAVLACAQNPQGAVLQGIDPERVASLVMMVGACLAAVGGTVAGSLLTLSPFMGGDVLSKGLVIIVLGGLGSLGGTVLAGLLLGISDSLVSIYLGAAMGSLFPVLMVIVLLLLKPEGLLGHA